MKINCILCGHKLDLDDDAYSDYEGEVKCWICGGILEINLKEGKMKSIKPRPVSEEAETA